MRSYDNCHRPRIVADDGRDVTATWHWPEGRPHTAVLIAPALATPARFYERLARHLATAGFLAVTFDYRGMESRAAAMAERGDMTRWIADAAAALEALHAAAPSGTPVVWLGHSLGGQILPFVPHELLDRAVFVASGVAYWRWAKGPLRIAAPIALRTVVPLSTRAAGYFPGRALRVFDDTPSFVMRQWARWCLHRRYLGVDFPDAASRFAAVKTPVVAFRIADDQLITERAHDELDSWYSSAPLTSAIIEAPESERISIGHHGLFRFVHQQLWNLYLIPSLRGQKH
ncbi:alpha/beta fold hydrolase [Streptomyces shenzhenensis]|uniref:alpha/beta hydrolase family protein n=1 Tax=Streptomyces shenzhenensis TaxID=943815 RepID=UPI0037F94BDC